MEFIGFGTRSQVSYNLGRGSPRPPEGGIRRHPEASGDLDPARGFPPGARGSKQPGDQGTQQKKGFFGFMDGFWIDFQLRFRLFWIQEAPREL